ncbi:hypothetical protein B0H19DRAFT_1074091 [Mycena capillaripes]|nr:hypothetical protein B0H19DRAFT_1074091 [Mycena capillaripes]
MVNIPCQHRKIRWLKFRRGELDGDWKGQGLGKVATSILHVRNFTSTAEFHGFTTRGERFRSAYPNFIGRKPDSSQNARKVLLGGGRRRQTQCWVSEHVAHKPSTFPRLFRLKSLMKVCPAAKMTLEPPPGGLATRLADQLLPPVPTVPPGLPFGSL